MPDGIAQLPDSFERRVFDDGFVEAHRNSQSGCRRCGHRREELHLKPISFTESGGRGDSRPGLL
jgi:hypothetical protein